MKTIICLLACCSMLYLPVSACCKDMPNHKPAVKRHMGKGGHHKHHKHHHHHHHHANIHHPKVK